LIGTIPPSRVLIRPLIEALLSGSGVSKRMPRCETITGSSQRAKLKANETWIGVQNLYPAEFKGSDALIDD
jgi:hypothetical protein